MPFRKILLTILFWSLGLGAVLGALAVLVAQYDTMWRIVITMILAAVAAALLLAASFLVDKENTRAGGLYYIALVVLQFLLALALTWIGSKFDYRFADRLAMTIFFSFLVGLPVGALVMAMRSSAGKIAGPVGIGFGVMVWLLLMGSTWRHSDWRYQDDFLAYAGAFAGFAPIFFFALLGVGDRRHWRWLGIAAGCAGLGIVCYAIHYGRYGDPTLLIAIIGLGAVVAHFNALMLLPLKPGQHWVRRITLAAGVATALLCDAASWTDATDDHWINRATASAAILAACGTLALLILALINRKVERKVESIKSIDQVTLICPICNTKHTLPSGDTRCPTCNVIIHIRFEEPHCPNCDYSLLMLQSDRCPECGTILAGQSA